MNANTLAVILLLFVIGSIILDSVFLHFLRIHHPDVWREIGEPAMFRNNNPATQVKIARYLLLRRYRNLEDKRLVCMFDCLGIFAMLSLLVFICFCISRFI